MFQPTEKEIGETLQVLNPWWKNGSVPLAQRYKRKAFSEMQKLLPYRQVLVVSGLRRVGKTTLLYQLIEHLLTKRPAQHILYFTFDKKVEEITALLTAYEHLTGVNWKKEKIVLFLDEVARLEEWGRKIKLLYDAFPNLKFVVSSSSSFLLEEEAVQHLAGRYFLLKIFPLSFQEFLELDGKEKWCTQPKLWSNELQKAFELYLLRSFPELITWKDELLIKDYLRTTIIDKIVRQDIPEKFKPVQKDLLFTLLQLFYSEPGMYLDYESLSRTLRISKKTLLLHIGYLEAAYLIRRLRNYRVSVHAASRKMQRVYPYWWTLAYCYTEQKDKILENLVASIIDASYFWREAGKEIDFLLVKKKRVLPLEVKNKLNLDSADSKHLIYFFSHFSVSEGVIIYRGEEKILPSGIHCLPFWHWALQPTAI